MLNNWYSKVFYCYTNSCTISFAMIGTFWIGAKYLKEDQRSILSCSQTFSQYLDDELYAPGYSGDCALFESRDDSILLTTSDCDDLNESVCEGNYVA